MGWKSPSWSLWFCRHLKVFQWLSQICLENLNWCLFQLLQCKENSKHKPSLNSWTGEPGKLGFLHFFWHDSPQHRSFLWDMCLPGAKTGKQNPALSMSPSYHEITHDRSCRRCYGQSSDPDTGFLKRFHVKWDQVDQTNIWAGFHEETIRPILKPTRAGTIHFARVALLHKGKVFRDNFQEFLVLSFPYFGWEIPNCKFKKPGALHQARRVPNVICAIKPWIFHDQLNLTARNLKFKDIRVFAFKVYLRG